MLDQPQPNDKPIQPPNLRTLKNGAIYDMDKKRIVANPGGGSHAITSERASEFHAIRQQQKRERIQAGANRVLAEKQPDKWETPNDLDFVEAIAEAAMKKALDQGDIKQIEAAKFIMDHAGLAEARAAQPGQAGGDMPALASELIGLIRDVIHERGIVIDADIITGDDGAT